MDRHKTDSLLADANDSMTEAMRAFNNSNAYEFENAMFNIRKSVRALESIAIEWADEVEKTERVNKEVK